MSIEMKPLSPEDLQSGKYRQQPVIVQARDAPAMNTDDIEMELLARGCGSKKSLADFAIRHSVRRTLPYGIWYCANGREVVFNREYQPIAQRVDGVVSYTDRNEFVQDIERSVMLYDDAHTPASYLTKHLGGIPQSGSDSNKCKKALLRSLTVLKEFTPPEHNSVSRQWSLR